MKIKILLGSLLLATVFGKPNSIPFTSHNLQKNVDCARCHFAGNPWNLKADKK